jgi:hypothetical protein
MKKEKALWFRSFWFEEQTAKIRMQVVKKNTGLQQLKTLTTFQEHHSIG